MKDASRKIRIAVGDGATGATEIQPANCGRMNRRTGCLPTARNHEKNASVVPRTGTLAVLQCRWQILLPGERYYRIPAIENR